MRRVAVLGCVLAAAGLPAAAPATTEPCFAFEGPNPTCPDLVATGATAAIVEDGAQLQVTVQVQNAGDAAAPASRVVVQAVGFESGVGDVAALEQQGSGSAVVVLAIPPEARGTTVEVVATVDPDDAVDERSEENNSASTSVDVPAETRLPDLEPATPAAEVLDGGARVELTVTVSNSGNAASPVAELLAQAEGFEPVSAEVPALEPGASADVGVAFDVPSDQRGKTVLLDVRIDPDEQIAESSDTNNVTRVQVELPPLPPERFPDLALGDVRTRFIDDGARVELTVAVGNAGDAAAPATRLEATAEGFAPARSDVGPLDPERSEEVSLVLAVPGDARGTTVEVTLMVDPDGTVRETAEANNSTATSVDVPAVQERLPDLTLEGPRSRVLDDGARLELTVRVRNIGEAPAPPVPLLAAADGLGSQRVPVPGLAAGTGTDSTLSLIVSDEARGTSVELTLSVDPDGAVAERSEEDNTTTLSVVLPALAERGGNGSGGRDLGKILAIAGIGAGLAAAAAAAVLRRRTTRARFAGPVPERAVNTGFSSEAGDQHDPDLPLACGTAYRFWLEVGPPVDGSIEETPLGLPPGLPAEATLRVALFSPPRGLQPVRGADVGTLVLERDGRARVGTRPDGGTPRPGERRLEFLVAAPTEEGVAEMRCNIYLGQTLLQSRLVSARVELEPARAPGALVSRLDYTLAPRLDAAHLARLPPHRLSIFANTNGDGTHSLSFLGEGEFKSVAAFDPLELQSLIDGARGALRKAAWGDEEPWAEGKPYLYSDGPDEGRLLGDLVTFALRGFAFYAQIVDRLAGGAGEADRLNELMRSTGFLQIATKESPRYLLPAALLYDYVGFDSTAPLEDYTLCPSFLAGLRASGPLDEHDCFSGLCPSRGTETVVCPSGFWGFRQRLGMPVSLAGAPDAVSEIAVERTPGLAVAVSTDPGFTLRTAHEEVLRALVADGSLGYASSRTDAIALLKKGGAHVVYFFCHGGSVRGEPFLQVGPLGERGITSAYLFSQRVRWTSPRPLVFVNGCRTTALEPEQALEFVSGLVRRAQAAGVVGTEITVFEPLARAFAEEHLRRFLAGAPLGEATRGARLALLKAGNPLGLAYVPFGLAGLRLVTPA